MTAVLDTPRARWMALVGFAGRAEPAMSALLVADFKHELVRERAASFPIREASAQPCAAAFLELANAFCVAGTHERRAAILPALQAAARLLDGLMHDEAAALAHRTWLRGDD